MQIKLVPRVIDDKGIECNVTDEVLVKTKFMNDPMVAKILTIDNTMVTLQFENRLIGRRPVRIRPYEAEVFEFRSHERTLPEAKK